VGKKKPVNVNVKKDFDKEPCQKNMHGGTADVFRDNCINRKNLYNCKYV